MPLALPAQQVPHNHYLPASADVAQCYFRRAYGALFSLIRRTYVFLFRLLSIWILRYRKVRTSEKTCFLVESYLQTHINGRKCENIYSTSRAEIHSPKPSVRK